MIRHVFTGKYRYVLDSSGAVVVTQNEACEYAGICSNPAGIRIVIRGRRTVPSAERITYPFELG
jgi:hypothetical protein